MKEFSLRLPYQENHLNVRTSKLNLLFITASLTSKLKVMTSSKIHNRSITAYLRFPKPSNVEYNDKNMPNVYSNTLIILAKTSLFYCFCILDNWVTENF